MMGKFATASALILFFFMAFAPANIFTAHAFAQTTAGQTPSATPTTPATNAQQPSSPQQPAEEEEESVREGISLRKKTHDYKNWNYNVGVGANVDSGKTKTFVRGGGLGATFGVARNANKYFGLRADAFAEDLPLKQSSLSVSGASSATSYLLALTLGPDHQLSRYQHVQRVCAFRPRFLSSRRQFK